MIEAPAANNRELTEVVFTAADLIPSSPESNRAKTAETLLNILEGRIRNSNTRNAYKIARRVPSLTSSTYESCLKAYVDSAIQRQKRKNRDMLRHFLEREGY